MVEDGINTAEEPSRCQHLRESLLVATTTFNLNDFGETVPLQPSS